MELSQVMGIMLGEACHGTFTGDGDYVRQVVELSQVMGIMLGRSWNFHR